VSNEIIIPTPPQFSFKRTVLSHGWCELPPFEIDRSNWLLTRVVGTGPGRATTVTLSDGTGSIKVRIRGRVAKKAAAKIERDVRHMMRLDDDLSAFHRAMAGESDFSWIARDGAGRLLRAPTVFEDLVKMICTTNCSWALTEVMLKSIVSSLGISAADGRRSFPTPEIMAEQPLSFYRDQARAGYRAPYLKELADRVASGSLNVEAWLTSELPTPELKREMKQVKGVGDYVAENILKLVGRYDGLALDSWLRGKFARVRNGGRKTTDKKIARCYARFHPWNGLALWCDMTRDWMEGAEAE
jgi:3-methyladenine DNA glycosylase/8-oxoguanine DNA glycosylase